MTLRILVGKKFKKKRITKNKVIQSKKFKIGMVQSDHKPISSHFKKFDDVLSFILKNKTQFKDKSKIEIKNGVYFSQSKETPLPCQRISETKIMLVKQSILIDKYQTKKTYGYDHI